LRRVAGPCFALMLLVAATPFARALGPVAVTDVDGRAWSLLAPPKGAIDLVFFVATDCPISNRYAPEISRICSDYKTRGVRCFLAYTDASATPASVKQHRSEFKLTMLPAVIDKAYTLTDAAGAKVTPEAAVFTAEGRVYHGRIDDTNPEIGKTRREATRHDVRLALDAVLAGKPIAEPETQAVGCYIERIKVP
jgi:hypothetical protein